MTPQLFESLSQFGVGGLMGALWVWERWLSRRREHELSQAHEQIMAERQVFRELVHLVQQNTQALERFNQTQQQLKVVLERMQSQIIGRVLQESADDAA